MIHPVISFWLGLLLQLARALLLLLADGLVWLWHRAGDLVATLRYYHQTRLQVMLDHQTHDDRRSAELADLSEAHNPWNSAMTAFAAFGSRLSQPRTTPGSRSATLRSRLTGLSAAVARLRRYLPRRRS